MKKYLQFIILLILSSAYLSNASYSIKMEIESKLETRVKQMISPLDPHAQVFVKTELKSIYSPLPGVAVESTAIGSAATSDKIDFDDIKKIQILVVTSIDEIPEWMKSEIEASLAFEKVPVQVNHKKFDPDFIKMVQKNSLLFQTTQTVKDDFITNFNSKSNFFIITLFAVTILVCATLFSLMAKFKTTFEQQTKFIIGQLASQPQNNHEVIDIVGEKQFLPKTETQKLNYSQFKYEQLSPETLAALLTDCYWCELDGYAHFIWSQLTPEQQKNVMQKVPFLNEYSQHFITQNSEDMAFANHPYYLHPTHFEHISQKDLADYVNQNLSLWHHLSPIRQQYLPISIQQKMKCFNSPAKQIEASSFNKKSTLRTLNIIGNIQNLTIADETYLLQNPDSIPKHLISKVPTLIWFAKLNLDIRQSLLSKLSAEDIATALIGPEQVVTSIIEALPEKKQKLVEQFKKQTQASRDSQAFQYLFTKSISQSSQTHEAKTA